MTSQPGKQLITISNQAVFIHENHTLFIQKVKTKI